MYKTEFYYADSDNEAYPEITYHETIRGEVAPEFANLSDEQIDLMLGELFEGMSPEEIEGFWGSLGKIARGAGRTLVQAAPTLLPIAGGALGTLIGGPAGTAIGAKLGGVAGKLVGSAATRGQRQLGTPVPQRGGRSAVPAGASSATAQLLALMNNPTLLRSLMSRLLGGAGRTEVLTAGEMVEVDCGSFLNALGELSAEAAREAHQEGISNTGTPEYLLTGDGELVENADLPERRAEILLELLNAADEEKRFESEAVSPEQWLMEAGLLETEL